MTARSIAEQAFLDAATLALEPCHVVYACGCRRPAWLAVASPSGARAVGGTRRSASEAVIRHGLTLVRQQEATA